MIRALGNFCSGVVMGEAIRYAHFHHEDLAYLIGLVILVVGISLQFLVSLIPTKDDQ